MSEFFDCAELLSEIIGGAIGGALAAVIITGGSYVLRRSKRRTIKELTEIRGRSIEHRTIGECRAMDNQDEWIKEAKRIHDRAFEIANKLSPAAGALIDWLGQVDAYDPTDKVARWVSVLTEINRRIQGILERNA